MILNFIQDLVNKTSINLSFCQCFVDSFHYLPIQYSNWQVSQYQIQNKSGFTFMQNQYKSPLKGLSKSKSKLSKSVTLGKQSKYKQQSESKNHAAFIKQISDRQPYKNLLNKLLRSQNLAKFVREAEKYADLNEWMVAPFLSKSMESERSRNQSYEYGKALLKDGSFIRYYCKLVEKEFVDDRIKVREFFFDKFRHEICLREKMFFDYFKEETNSNEDSNSFSFSKSKGKERTNSKPLSQKKAKTESNFSMKEYDKSMDALSVFERIDSSTSFQTKDQKEQIIFPKSQTKKAKTVHFQEKSVDELADQETYHSPFRNDNLNQTDEQRQFRFSGLRKASKLKSSEKRKSTIVKFEDELKSNQRLKKAYEQILKEKKQIERIIASKQLKQTEKPLIRQTIDRVYQEAMQLRLKQFSNEDKEKLDEIQQQILAHYPTIHLKANKKGILISAIRDEGYYKNYIIKKAVLTDINHFMQPNYIGIVLEKVQNEKNLDMSPCQFQQDDRTEVVLFE